MARLGDEGNPGKVRSGREYVALAGNQRSAKGWVEKVFLRQFPGYDLVHRRTGLTRRICQRTGMLPRDDRLRRRAAHGESRHDGIAILRLRRSALGVETRHETILDLMGIGEDVAFVELQNVGEAVDTGHIAIGGARLDDVLPLSPHEFFVEHALQGWWAQFHGSLQGAAINGIFYCLPRVLSNQSFCVKSFM